ncbi:hypothetical protein AVEN_45222-1 [Araneus ventricosus]|uniref:Uncharacterized protein n=1 Tax=Araneus ventricosus TaxID=182803 RepID=A0A4Y2ML59_ARAVE|nr:hypothetical protein AVEN_45222-1 [Araneus ventricosus]
MTHQILWLDVRGTDFETSPGSRGLSRAPLRKTEEGAKIKGKFLPLLPEISCQSSHFFSPLYVPALAPPGIWRHGQLPGLPGPRAASEENACSHEYVDPKIVSTPYVNFFTSL